MESIRGFYNLGQCIIIPLTRGYVTVIDNIDIDLANKNWQVAIKPNNNNDTYARTKYDGKYQMLHRIILERILNRPLKTGELSDHINRNPLDNRRSNIRVVNYTHNVCNRSNLKNSITKLMGISPSIASHRFEVVLQYMDTRISKHFFNIHDAIEFRNMLVKKYHDKYGVYTNDINWDSYMNIHMAYFLERMIYKYIHNTISSQYNGVTWRKARKYWVVYIYHNGKNIYIGSSHNEIVAAKMYDKAALKYKGAKARLNFSIN